MTGGRAAIEVGVAGIGLLGPGLPDWASGRAMLADPAAWQRAPTAVPAPPRLPPTERRRASVITKASVAVADECCRAAAIDPARPATVFASASGDPANCHALCEALAAPERAVSPTRFTNSVHNAPAGAWHIAVRSMRPSTSLAADDATVAAGLLEAAVQCAAAGEPVLLVGCDMPYPPPLAALRRVDDVFAYALLLVPPVAGLPALGISLGGDADADGLDHAGLEALRRGIPAARVLPLVQALARGAPAVVTLADAPGPALRLELRP